MSKFVKFLSFGLITYWINIWLTFFLVDFLCISKSFAYFISVTFVTVLNFIISIKFTFGAAYSHKLLKNYLISLILLSLLNYILVIVFKNYLKIDFYLLIFTVTTFIFLLKFVIYDKYVFKWWNNWM